MGNCLSMYFYDPYFDRQKKYEESVTKFLTVSESPSYLTEDEWQNMFSPNKKNSNSFQQFYNVDI